MEKRLVLTIALSLLVLLSWSALVQKIYHIDNKEVTREQSPSKVILSSPNASVIQKQKPSADSLLKLSQDKYDIFFIEEQAAIKEAIFKDYQSSRLNLEYGFLLKDPALIFKQVNSSSKNEIKFVHSDINKNIIKRFILSNLNYSIELIIEVENLSNLPLKINLPLLLGVLNRAGDQIEARYQDITVATPEKIMHLDAHKNTTIPETRFLGLRNRYFTAIIEPIIKNRYTTVIQKINPQETEIILNSIELTLQPREKIEQKFHIYLGPQELKLINQLNTNWSVVMYYGAFNLISHFLLQLLDIIYRLIHNWGWAIVILSVIIYIIVYPLTLKQMRSMKEMQSLQPAIEELRKNYQGNPKKLNKEIMDLYRKHKVSPFGGCLPLLLQIPIFFALYQALMRSIALKGANFLWIQDLSKPDNLFTVTILNNKIDINILPILMSIGMFIQQKTSFPKTGTTSAEQQKLMMILFPLMFGWIFYRMPAGLVLYWFINSTLMLIYQFRIKRH